MRILMLVATLSMAGCASNNKAQQSAVDNNSISSSQIEQAKQSESAPGSQISDPLEGINRLVWDFNYEILDRFLVKPITKGYIAVMPQFARTGLLNAAENLEEPANMANNLFQGKVKDSAASLTRFVVNSTIGMLGTFDIAEKMGIAPKEEDFGQVLGVWGLGTGPYLMLPALGPSDIRSFAGDVVDNVYWPLSVLESQYVIAANVVSVIETRATLLDQEEQLKRALDPYLFVRDAYFQRLAFLVSDGQVKAKSEEQIKAESDNFEDFEGLLDDL